MNSDLHVLVISYGFPPDAEVGGKRVAGLCRYLPGYGIQPVVLTVQERFYEARDESFPAVPGIRIERTTRFTNPLEWYGRWKARIRPGRASSSIASPQPRKVSPPGFLRRQIMGLLNLPDRYWGWYLPALREATRLIREERIAALLSSGPPWTAHLIARRLRKKYRLPWLADFRDPWTQSRTPEQLPSWWKRLRQRLEASCIRWADLVVCNTDALRQNFAERYPGMPNTKWVTLTNGFDDSIADPPPKESNSSTRLLLHLGDIYGIRRTDTFFQAIADLAKAGKLDPTCTKIVFFGGADLPARVAARQWAGELVQSSCIEFRPRVSWRQAQEALWKADLLLLFQGGYRRTVPAKFYEYLQTGKPIFAVAEEGALTDLVGETESGIWADPGDPTNIAKKLLLALGLSARPPAEIQQRWAGKYHYRSLSGRLAEWVYKLAGAGAVGQPSPS